MNQSRWANSEIPKRRTYRQLRRVFDVLRVIIDLDVCTIPEIHRELRETIGVEVCERTVRRDVELLRAAALVDFVNLPARAVRLNFRRGARVRIATKANVAIEEEPDS